MTVASRHTRSRRAAKRYVRFGSQLVISAVVVLGGLLMMSPLIWVILNSVETPKDQFSLPPVWFPKQFSWSSYEYLFTHLPFGIELLNTVIVTVLVVVGSTIISVLAAYAFARINFPGREVVFAFFLVALMVPVQVAAVPQFLIVKQLGMLDSLASLIVPALIQAFSVFLLRQHIRSIPEELDEAAKLDGASRLVTLRIVIVPMSWPAISAVAVITGQYIWNDFFWPTLFLSSNDKMTASLGLVTLQSTFQAAPVGAIFAGISILAVPIVIAFIFLQRRLTKSLSFAGISR